MFSLQAGKIHGVAACLDGSPYADREAEHSRLIPDIAWALQERDSKGPDSKGPDSKGPDSSTKDGHLIVTAAPLTYGRSNTPGVNSSGRRREDDENLVVATLNSGGNSGGFRTEPGEHLVIEADQCHGSNVGPIGTLKGNNVTSGVPFVTHPLRSDTAETLQVVAFESRFARNGRGAPDEITAPLKAESGRTGKGDGAPLAAGGFGVRRLTPLECERLQNFPDQWTAFDAEGNSISDSARYRMLGNAVTVSVAQWIAERIVKAMIGEAKD